MPEPSVGGSLTKRPPQPRESRVGRPDVRSVDVDARARMAAAAEGWRRALAGSGMPDTLLATGPNGTASWLDLTHTHPSGLAQLFAARPTRLSSLFREQAAHTAAVRQARAIRISAMSLSAQRGVQASCLAIGVASWTPRESADRVQAPVVLRACSIRPRHGAEDDFDLDLDDGVLINPELLRELTDSYGIEADGNHLALLAHGDKGFDPRPVYAWLEERAAPLRGFTIERSLVLATFAAGSGAVLSDLDASAEAIWSHRTLGRLAGTVTLPDAEEVPAPRDPSISPVVSLPAEKSSPDAAAETEGRRLAMIGRLGPRGPRQIKPPAEPDPATELLVLDVDHTQQSAVAAALRGEDVVVEGPPGTGATQAVAAAVAGLVAAGRKVLVLSPRRDSTESLLRRLADAGLSDLVLDLRDSVTGQQAIRTSAVARALRAALDAATDGPPPELPLPGRASSDEHVIEALRANRGLLDGEAEALHEVRQPWGISAYDAMVALAGLHVSALPQVSDVRFDDATLLGLDGVTRERLRGHLHAAAEAAAFTLSRDDTRWYDARVTTAGQARAALEAAAVLRAGLDRARGAMSSVTTAAGLRPAERADDWLPLLDLLLGVRTVVDSMSAQIYDQPLPDLAAAVAGRGRRDNDMPRGERRRLKKLAQSLVRPGVYVQDLHAMLLTAYEQRQRWWQHREDDGTPRVVGGLTEAQAAVGQVFTALDVLERAFDGSGVELRSLPLDELEARVADLAGDSDGVLGQPRRHTLVDGLRQAGLGPLVDDLARRGVGPDLIDVEFDVVWWSSVRDSIVRSDRRLSGHDPHAAERARDDLRSAETAHLAAGAGLVRSAVLARAARAVAAHGEQVQVLRRELAREDRRPRMIDLIRGCGDILAAVTPVWVMSPDTVAACLAPAVPGGPPIIDTVVVDDAGHIGLPEVVAAMSRARQVVVAGDRRRQSVPDDVPSVIAALAPVAKVFRLERDHRTHDGRMMVPLAPIYPEGWQLTPGIEVAAPLRLDVVADGTAVPSPGEELPVSSDAEVRRVVELVQAHAVANPSQSLAVVTLSERHAERVEEALRSACTDSPVLAEWLAKAWVDELPEAFAVRPVQRVLGMERDAVIVSIGLARTPHGRVLHRFGALDARQGPAALTTSLSRARVRTTVVCCFGAEDLVVDRLRTPGARLLRDVLLAASGRGTARLSRATVAADGLIADLRERLAGAGLEVQSRVGDGDWALDVAVADPRMPGRMLVAVDVDGPAFSSRACREREWFRARRWEQAGWSYLRVCALDLFNDPAREVARIRAAWERAMDSAPPSAGGVPSSVMSESEGPQDRDDEPVLPEQSRDDTDAGWGEGSGDRDDELQRERPPHWE